MITNTQTINLDGGELFTACLAQATRVVKQVLPNHLTNVTPDAEWDVRDLLAHMMQLISSVPVILQGGTPPAAEESLSGDTIDDSIDDVTVLWQAAADKAEAAIEIVDIDDTIQYHDQITPIENFLIEIAGDLLIHAWDLGEAIGMPVHFDPIIASAVMETTVIPNQFVLEDHGLFTEPIEPPANADMQTRLLALFGRSHAWRSAV